MFSSWPLTWHSRFHLKKCSSPPSSILISCYQGMHMLSGKCASMMEKRCVFLARNCGGRGFFFYNAAPLIWLLVGGEWGWVGELRRAFIPMCTCIYDGIFDKCWWWLQLRGSVWHAKCALNEWEGDFSKFHIARSNFNLINSHRGLCRRLRFRSLYLIQMYWFRYFGWGWPHG